MKKIYRILKSMACSLAGAWIGYSLYEYYDYRKHPGLYELRSAPWYTGIQVTGVFTAVLIVICLILMWLIRKKS